MPEKTVVITTVRKPGTASKHDRKVMKQGGRLGFKQHPHTFRELMNHPMTRQKAKK